MVIMSRDVVDVPSPQRIYQQRTAGSSRLSATTPTRYALSGTTRHNGSAAIDRPPLSLPPPPPPAEDTYLLRSVSDKKVSELCLPERRSIAHLMATDLHFNDRNYFAAMERALSYSSYFCPSYR